MNTAVTTSTHFVSLANPELTQLAKEAPRRSPERRRSPRVALERALPCQIDYLGRAALHTVSLGGAMFLVSGRPTPGMLYRVRLLYGDTCTESVVSFYRTLVHDLYYSSKSGSRIRYLASATHYNPSVATLNQLYRILGDHWVDPGDDDTTPLES